MKKLLLSIVAMVSSLFVSCTNGLHKITPVYDKGIHIIPLPMQLQKGDGYFQLSDNTKIIYDSPQTDTIANYFASIIRTSTGYKLPVELAGDKDNNITISINPKLNLNDEGYILHSDDQGVSIVGKTTRGLFYGMQTLMQLLPAEIESPKEIDSIAWNIPSVDIKDEPVFPYRGMLIDVCRHFLTVQELKRQIDVLTLFKINYLHLHLTDDQGWRIEIKKYPRLTEIGSKRIEGDGTEYGGYYTQNEIKDIVKYAQKRFITIIPEIEMPGHAMGAIAAYPDLACFKKNYKVRNIWGIEKDVYCAGNDQVFQFISDVMDEVAPLFPGKYIHIGGDECPKDRWKICPKCQARMRKEHLKTPEELQSYFIKRAEKIVEQHGKRLIGWDEILEGGLPASATVMSWRGEKGGIEASNMGHDVIMTPGSGGLYLDHYQGDPMVEPLAICCHEPMAKVYSYNPIPKDIKPSERHHILGAQGNLWSEYLYSPYLYEYRAYPRMLAIAELTWTPQNKKNYEDFCRRLDNAYVRLDMLGISYHIPIPEQPNGSCNNIAFTDSTTLTFQTSRPIKIIYAINADTLIPAKATVYTNPIVIKKNCEVLAASLLPSGKLSHIRHIQFTKEIYQKAIVPPTNLLQGLRTETSIGNYKNAKELISVKNWTYSTVKNLSDIIPDRKNYNDNSNIARKAVIASGYIKIPTDGVFEFNTNYEQLWLDGKLLIDNTGIPNKFSPNATTIALAKGLHSIKIVFIGIVRGGFPSYWDNGNIQYRVWGTKKMQNVSPDMIFYSPSNK